VGACVRACMGWVHGTDYTAVTVFSLSLCVSAPQRHSHSPSVPPELARLYAERKEKLDALAEARSRLESLKQERAIWSQQIEKLTGAPPPELVRALVCV
jgi:hypothetical protein